MSPLLVPVIAVFVVLGVALVVETVGLIRVGK